MSQVANIQSIEGQIQESLLLSPDRKTVLLEKLSIMPEELLTKLQIILSLEEKLIAALSGQILTKAVDTANNGVLAQFEAFFAESNKNLNKADEGGEKTGEEKEIEHLLEN